MKRRLWLLLALVAPAPAAQAAPVEYTRDIRPILSENCFACHGPDKPKRKADLRLDNEAGAYADLGGHFALVAGKPADSELYRRVSATGRLRMPPASTGKTLSRRQIDLIRQWIEQGAKYQKHWSLITPVRPAI